MVRAGPEGGIWGLLTLQDSTWELDVRSPYPFRLPVVPLHWQVAVCLEQPDPQISTAADVPPALSNSSGEVFICSGCRNRASPMGWLQQ